MRSASSASNRPVIASAMRNGVAAGSRIGWNQQADRARAEDQRAGDAGLGVRAHGASAANCHPIHALSQPRARPTAMSSGQCTPTAARLMPISSASATPSGAHRPVAVGEEHDAAEDAGGDGVARREAAVVQRGPEDGHAVVHQHERGPVDGNSALRPLSSRLPGTRRDDARPRGVRTRAAAVPWRARTPRDRRPRRWPTPRTARTAPAARCATRAATRETPDVGAAREDRQRPRRAAPRATTRTRGSSASGGRRPFAGAHGRMRATRTSRRANTTSCGGSSPARSMRVEHRLSGLRAPHRRDRAAIDAEARPVRIPLDHVGAAHGEPACCDRPLEPVDALRPQRAHHEQRRNRAGRIEPRVGAPRGRQPRGEQREQQRARRTRPARARRASSSYAAKSASSSRASACPRAPLACAASHGSAAASARPASAGSDGRTTAPRKRPRWSARAGTAASGRTAGSAAAACATARRTRTPAGTCTTRSARRRRCQRGASRRRAREQRENGNSSSGSSAR